MEIAGWTAAATAAALVLLDGRIRGDGLAAPLALLAVVLASWSLAASEPGDGQTRALIQVYGMTLGFAALFAIRALWRRRRRDDESAGD